MTSLDKKDASKLTDAQLNSELNRLGKEFANFRRSLDEEGGMSGSPGEWYCERMDEIKTEMRRRNRAR